MLIRGISVAICFVLVIGIASFNLPSKPKPPEEQRWIKIDAHGNSLEAWAGPWKCVLDSETKLLWEVKSYAEDIHDHQCSFSWFNQKFGAKKRGDCFIEGEASDTYDLITAANTEHYCGSTHWRLPTEKELASLIINHPKPGAPLIAQDYFPYTKNAPYWTSNANQPLTGHFRHLKEGATSIDFSTGESDTMPYKNAAFVRLVASYKKEESE